MTRVPTAYDVERAVALLRERLWEPAPAGEAGNTGEDDETALYAAATLGSGAEVGDINVLLERLLLATEEAGAEVEMCRTRKQQIAARQERAVNREKRLKALALELLAAFPEVWPKGKFRSALVTAYTSARRHIVITGDLEKMDPQFVRVQREPNKTEIGKALNDGEVVEGAAWSNYEPTLVIKT